MAKNTAHPGMQTTHSRRAHPTIEMTAADSDVTSALFKRVKGCMAPATPATWSKYIDSRLKQFCTR